MSETDDFSAGDPPDYFGDEAYLRGDAFSEPKDPVPPFPQEPAFGSPEAVEQAAETIRGFTPGPWEVAREASCFVVKSRGCRIAKVLLHKRGSHRGQSASYYATPFLEADAALIASAPDLLAEVERLRAEREGDAEIRSALNAAGLQASAREEEALRQRDTLADALESEVAARRWRPISEWDSAPVGRLCEVGEEQDGIVYSREITARTDGGGKIHYRWTHFRECLNGEPEAAVAALRKAGRLP